MGRSKSNIKSYIPINYEFKGDPIARMVARQPKSNLTLEEFLNSGESKYFKSYEEFIKKA